MGNSENNNKELTVEQIREIAAQLRKPAGEMGVEMGHIMNEANVVMIDQTLETLQPLTGEAILEIGHGNANHLQKLIKMAPGIKYTGLDISETMHLEAKKYCAENGLESQTTFVHYEGQTIPFESQTFDKIFTINTLYFWESPEAYLNELHRILKPGGKLLITYAEEESMDKLPFTSYGFTKYSPDKFEKLIKNSKFILESNRQYVEKISSKVLTYDERKFRVGVANLVI
jgi:ubiquinone/menaquinone biosynthesis C-methylase UbiE